MPMARRQGRFRAIDQQQRNTGLEKELASWRELFFPDGHGLMTATLVVGILNTVPVPAEIPQQARQVFFHIIRCLTFEGQQFTQESIDHVSFRVPFIEKTHCDLPERIRATIQALA